MPELKKEAHKGWYVEIPFDLYQAFDQHYPSRGAKTILTIAAIRYALKMCPPADALSQLYATRQRDPSDSHSG